MKKYHITDNKTKGIYYYHTNRELFYIKNLLKD